MNASPLKTCNMDPLLRPGSVAIIGCSGDSSRLSGRPLKFLLAHGYQGGIYPVNPKYDEISGLRCYPSIQSVPKPVDVALLIVPVHSIESAVKDCIETGVNSAIIFSSGFAELGEEGRISQERIKRLAEAGGLPILGPNCLGLINLVDDIPLSFSSVLDEDRLEKGNLAMVSQSGALSAYILGAAQAARIGFSYWVTTGNEVSLNTFDIVRSLLKKEEVGGVLVYLEESKDSSALLEAGRLARELKKPLICLKVGRSQSGMRAAMSHTGALAGSDEEYGAAFRKAGIVRADTIEELLDLGVVLGSGSIPRGNRVAVMTISGGGGIICADACEKSGLRVPELGPETQRKLREIMPKFGSPKNPVDLTAELIASPGLLKKSVDIILSDGDIDSIVLFLGGNRKNAVSLSKDIIDMDRRSRETVGKPILVTWMAAAQESVELLRGAGVPVLFDGVRTVRALAKLVEYGQRRRTSAGTPDRSFEPEKVRSMLLSEIPKDASGVTCALSEYTAKKALGRLGLSIPKGGLATSAGEALAIAEAVGYPVVAKVSSRDILHKSDARALQIGIEGPAALEGAYRSILENARKACPDAEIDGVLVEEMIPEAAELIVGLRWSREFGSVVLCGAGGIFVELLGDSSLRLAPVTQAEALEMVADLKTAKLLSGFRGMPARDIEAAARAIVAVSELGAAMGRHLVELDINPLFVLKKGAGVRVGDALMVLQR